MSNLAIDFRNPVVLRNLGIDALVKELTPVGMAYFLRQYEMGSGDYTKDRYKVLNDLSMEDFEQFLKDSNNV